MKHIFASILSITIILLCGCTQKDGGNPNKVLSDFFDALAKKDIETAKKLTTDDSEPMMNMAQMAMQNIQDSGQILQYRKENIELGNAVITGDNATIPVTDKKSGETIDFTLKKEASQWKVSINYSTLMQVVRKKIKEHGMDRVLQYSTKDSLGILNNATDSVTAEDKQKAQNMMDSAKKIFNDAK